MTNVLKAQFEVVKMENAKEFVPKAYKHLFYFSKIIAFNKIT